MGDLYYVGDTVNLGFEIVVDESSQIRMQPTKLTSITVSVYSKEGNIIYEDPVTVIDNVAKYTIDASMTKHAGDYAAFFRMVFNGEEVKTYQMPFTILPRSISAKSKDMHVGRLKKGSTDNEIERAIREDLREMRKKGGDPNENSKLIFEIAQYILGRRLPRW